MAALDHEEEGTDAVQMEMEPLVAEGVRQSREDCWGLGRTKNTGLGTAGKRVFAQR